MAVEAPGLVKRIFTDPLTWMCLSVPVVFFKAEQIGTVWNSARPLLTSGFQASRPVTTKFIKHAWDNPGSTFFKFTLITVVAANALNKLGIVSPTTATNMKSLPVKAGRTLGEGLGLSVKALGPVVTSVGAGAVAAVTEAAKEAILGNQDGKAPLNKAEAQQRLGAVVADRVRSDLYEVFDGLRNGLIGAVKAITPQRWHDAAAKVRNAAWAIQNVPTGNLLLGTACGALAIYGTYRFVYPSPKEIEASKAKKASKQNPVASPELKEDLLTQENQALRTALTAVGVNVPQHSSPTIDNQQLRVAIQSLGVNLPTDFFAQPTRPEKPPPSKTNVDPSHEKKTADAGSSKTPESSEDKSLHSVNLEIIDDN